MQPYLPPQQTDGKAVGSLVLGILSLTCASLFTGIPAIILGHLAHSNIRKSNGRLTGQGMAIAGLIMGYVSVVIFIPLFLAIMIPNLLRERFTANESAAASSVRMINTAQVVYNTTYPNAGFAHNLSTLGSCTAGTGTAEHACLLDASLSCNSTWCRKSGYNFNVAATECDANGVCAGYVIIATPQSTSTGRQRYCSTADAVIRHQDGGPMANPPSSAECQSWPPIT